MAGKQCYKAVALLAHRAYGVDRLDRGELLLLLLAKEGITVVKRRGVLETGELPYSYSVLSIHYHLTKYRVIEVPVTLFQSRKFHAVKRELD